MGGACRLRRLRSFLQFAEEEVVFGRGPRKGLKFRADFAPWAGAVLREFDNPWWWRRFGMGSVQSGKTMIFYVIPALYHLFEIGESIILAAPNMQLIQDRWEIDILPVIEQSRYRDLLPRSGGGSRGGRVESYLFGNGARVIFMSAGGGDVKRSSHTARVVLITESDKMDEPAESSREAAPPQQFEARAAAYGESAIFYGECTISFKTGYIYQQVAAFGSGSRINLRCPHCSKYIYPERTHFIGWRDADNEIDAGDLARYACNSCGVAWTEQDHMAALKNVILVHRGQEIAPDGVVTGPIPKTHTLGVEWNWLASPMTPMSQIGAMEWRSERAVTQDEEKQLCQFRWVLPWEEDSRTTDLSPAFLAQHTGDFHFDPLRDLSPSNPPAPLPEGPEFWTYTIDVQKRWLYEELDGWDMDLTRWTTFWRVREIVPQDRDYDPTEQDLIDALNAAWKTAFVRYNARSLWVDAGYNPENLPVQVVRKWASEHDACNPLLGRASSQYAKITGKNCELPADVPQSCIQARIQDDDSLLWFLDVDQLRDELYNRLFRAQGAKGYHWFAREAADTTRTRRTTGRAEPGWIFKHYLSVKREIRRDNAGREVRIWKEGARHDMVDVGLYALAGAIVTRAYLLQESETQHGSTVALDVGQSTVGGGIRTKY